jgi:hypothetical protein
VSVPEQYVYVTFYQPPGDKPPVVHVWGPYPNRTTAITAMRRSKRSDEREDPRADEVVYWPRKVIGDRFPDTEHRYLSTGCLHDDHTYCQSMTGQQGEKRPGRCKFCDAACVCPCHRTAL